MRVIHVLRKPLSEGTVAANTLRHGTGGLNIDASRIEATGERPMRERADKGFQQVYGAGLGGSIAVAPTTVGRWPANVIFQHLDGCRCDGVKRVPSNGNFPAQQKTASWKMSSKGKALSPDRTYREGGKETIANWICEPGCPVARLDEQSGVIKGVVRQPTGKAVYPTEGAAMNWNSNSVIDNTVRGFGDSGGASRFYKQVGGGKVSE